MKKCLITLFVIMIMAGCGDYSDNTELTFYDFYVENGLEEDIIIMPADDSMFWITDAEEYYIVPGERYIIGTTTKWAKRGKAYDYLLDNDVISSFNVYTSGGEALSEDLCLRKKWDFSSGKTKSSAVYTLLIK